MGQQPPQDYGAGEAQYGEQLGGQSQAGQQLGGPQQGSQLGGTGSFGQGQGQIGQLQPIGSPGGPQGMDIKLEEGMTDEMRVVLHDLVQSATACEWCAERCIDEGPGMAECLRLCRDVADLATLNVQLMARDSVFGPEAIEVFANAAEACARECAHHGHRHCQECAEVLSRAVQSTRKMLASFGGSQQFGGQGQQFGGQSQGMGQPQAGQLGGLGQPSGLQGGQQSGEHYYEGGPSGGQPGTQGPGFGQQF